MMVAHATPLAGPGDLDELVTHMGCEWQRGQQRESLRAGWTHAQRAYGRTKRVGRHASQSLEMIGHKDQV